jgi:hypothetical protein
VMSYGVMNVDWKDWFRIAVPFCDKISATICQIYGNYERKFTMGVLWGW